MKKKIAASIAVVLLAALTITTVFAGDNYSSTNEWNRSGQNPAHPGVVGPHVHQIAYEDGQLTLGLVNPFTDFACFEYRVDGTDAISQPVHPNPDVEGPYYLHRCVSNGIFEQTFSIDEKVEVRLVHMSHPDWYFDWTTFPDGSGTTPPDDTTPPEEHEFEEESTGPATRADCKRDGWQDHGFRNQGQCIRYVNTGQDSR